MSVDGFPLAYGLTTTDNPWETIIPDFCRGPDFLYAAGVVHGGGYGWVPRRGADLRAIYTDTEHFTNRDMAPYAGLVGSDWQVLPLEAEAPSHGLYRKLLNPVFSPKSVAELDEKMRVYARRYALAMRDAGAADFMASFAFEFPIRVFLELMAMPQELVADFLGWEKHLIHSQEVGLLADATRKVVRYLTETIEERKRRPGEDLISYAIGGPAGSGSGLSDKEILGICFNLFIGGMDTVSTNIGWQFFHLATHPEDQARLRADPSVISDALDEFMRYYAAVTTYRRCVKPYETDGGTIMPGDHVAMITTFAARDDREVDNPHDFILDRRPRHVSFGYGPHLCLGMPLARREMKIALEEVLQILPEFHLAPDPPVLVNLHNVIQPENLPLEWDPR
jgi:cytochrome P450